MNSHRIQQASIYSLVSERNSNNIHCMFDDRIIMSSLCVQYLGQLERSDPVRGKMACKHESFT